MESADFESILEVLATEQVDALSPARYLEFKRASSRPKDAAMVPVLSALVDEQ
jgi:hypothetical protein